MEDLSRTEYPTMLASLQPTQAVQVLQDRVRRIGKVNQEVADWLQERRRVEEQYVAGLRKLLLFKVPNSASELGVFQPTWDAVIRSVDTIANSHHIYGQRVEKDVEAPLRAFQGKKEMANMATISGNLQAMAHELDEAQQRASRLGKKGGKANTQKVDTAAAQLESATQQWESQAPFIFETLQALDELRVNHLRDVLTQLETHEVDQAARTQAAAEAMLNLILEINTADEIQGFSKRITAGRPRIDRRSTRQSSVATASTTTPQPPLPRPPSSAGPDRALPVLPSASHSLPAPGLIATPAVPSASAHDDNASEHSSRNETPQTESKLRSRIGTMLGRRRQSIQGFGQLSPSGKGTSPFSRMGHSSHGRTVSPRASSHNLAEPSHRLSSLAEAPSSPVAPSTADTRTRTPRDGTTNGFGSGASGSAESGTRAATGPATTFDDIFNVPPPPGPPPSHLAARANEASKEPTKDAEGFSVPAAANDPISQAQRAASSALGGESGEDADHAFMLNIQEKPVADEDAKAKEAALSNVASTLSMAMPSRKGGTVRGRRDVRNTIYVPTPPPTLPEASSSSGLGTAQTNSPAATVSRSSTFASPTTPSRPSAVAALASEASFAGTSDTQSVRSATSLTSLAHLKHADATGPGLSTSIIETVSAAFEDGELKTAKIAGEIAFSYMATDSPKETETIRINNFPLLEVIGPNRIFVQNTAAADEFTLATAHLQPRASVGFTFRAHGADATALGGHCPLVLKPAWKPTGDKLGLLLQYRLNPVLSAQASSSSLTLRNVVFIATYEGARASGVQTKPSGTHLKDKHLVYWRLGELHLTDTWAKIVCRVVGEQGAEPQPGHIEARWEYAASSSGSDLLSGMDITISRQTAEAEATAAGDEEDDAEDPFADDGPKTSKAAKAAGSGWAAVPLVRQIVSGRYEAK